MDVVKLPATAAVTVTETETETETVAAPPSSGAIRLVIGWAIIAACSIFFVRAVDYILYFLHVHCHPASIVLRCVHLTDAEADEEFALWVGILCCAALQAAAAVLALLLPSRSRRRRLLRHAIEFVALAAAILDHCMYITVVRLVLAADPGYLFFRISRSAFIVFLAVGDIVASIALIPIETRQY